MKLTKASLLKKTPELFDTPDSVYLEFQDYYERENAKLPENLVLLYADYTYEDYNGDAYVLGYDKEKKQFFEVHGSHCSCYGLEGQWDEEYCEDVKQLQVAIERRFSNRSEYSRYAYSSEEFQKWLES